MEHVTDLGTAHGAPHGGTDELLVVSGSELLVTKIEAALTLRFLDRREELTVDELVPQVIRARDGGRIGRVEVQNAAAAGKSARFFWSGLLGLELRKL